MAFNYCKSCGHKNIFTLDPPNFCGGCGNSFVSASPPKSTKTKARKKASGRAVAEGAPDGGRDKYEDFDPDGLDIFKVPKIDKLSYSIEMDPSNKINLSDLIDVEEFQEFNDEEEKPKLRGKSKARGDQSKNE